MHPRATTTAGSRAQVDEFVETLPAASHRLLEYLAVADPLPLADAVALAGADAVDEAVRTGAVVVDDDRLRPAHPLFVDAVRGALGGPDLRRLRTALVERLSASGGDGVVGRLRRAVLAIGSDRPQPVPDACAAAQEALRLGDLELSERLGRAALGARSPTWPPGSPSDTRWRGRAAAGRPTRCSRTSTRRH